MPPSVGPLFEDELLYSWCSRHHVVAGNARDSTTCLQLFGHPLFGSAHDFPCRLEEFIKRTGGELGTVESITYSNTLLPYYLRFCSADRVSRAMMSVRQGGIGSLKAELGILATRFGACHPLKACTRCLEVDSELHGMGYWHVTHQLPGVLLCPKHGFPLLGASVKTNGNGRFQWYLPRRDILHPVDEVTLSGLEDIKTRDLLGKLAACSIGIHNAEPMFRVEPTRFASVVMDQLHSMGLVTPGGSVRQRPFCEMILELTSRLRIFDTFAALPDSLSAVSSQFCRLTRTPRTATHPIRCSILILAFFGSWSAFREVCDASVPDEVDPIRIAKTDRHDQRRRKMDASMRDDILQRIRAGESCRSVATSVGIDTTTAMSWAASAGISVSRRAKSMTAEVRQTVVCALMEGKSKAEVSEEFGISFGTFRYLLRTETGLRRRWVDACFERTRSALRTKWAGLASRNPTTTSTGLRGLDPATFTWLYRNDCAWLQDFSSRLTKATRTNNASVDWQERDITLAEAIRLTASSRLDLFARQCLTRAQLFDAIPRLKPLTKKLTLLPLVRAAIEEVTSGLW